MTYFGVLTTDAHSEEFRTAEQEIIAERIRAINDLLLAICIEKKGGILHEKASCALLAESTDQR
jgi:hypothetical protein